MTQIYKNILKQKNLSIIFLNPKKRKPIGIPFSIQNTK